MQRSILATAIGTSLLASTLTIPHATAAENTCANPSFDVESGTIDWGIKQTWRNYIDGPIANGAWTVSGMTEHGTDKAGPDFYFSSPIDPASVKLTANNGTPAVTSLAATGTAHFTGHHDALDVTLGNFGVDVSGNQVTVKTDYTSYYVPGKAMTSLTPEDKTEQNKVTGRDVIAQGTTTGWKFDQGTLTLEAPGLKYVKHPESTRDLQKGADRAFMGAYRAGDPMDTVKVSLKLKATCADSPAPAPAPNKPGENPAPAPAPAPNKPGENPAPAPAPAPNKPGKENNQDNGFSLGSSGTDAGILAALGGLFGLAGVAIAKHFGLMK
ncbi:HtaA domain-containing protein [Corynebacterium hindlerae]|uniref:HtaA domain-containing protein n=1 Tax=Corynebacterium hindlerae TaxID=699041 RepID=A0A7G5FDA4_9CORY|nr:HtaA domain-containing protein [Corynebacterium hindlerae]QMV84595.1 HtaA domain-containing protein [Corynebacterium hindlerae]